MSVFQEILCPRHSKKLVIVALQISCALCLRFCRFGLYRRYAEIVCDVSPSSNVWGIRPLFFFFFTVVCLLTKESLSNTNGRGPLNDIWNENSFIISYKTQLWSGKDVPKNWLNVLWPELAERCIASFEDLPLSFFFFFSECKFIF